ncbi:MAG: phosphatidylserine decarboxylase, partial [Candidatus Aminicenantes bacterium]|nr:phosphatidylserine decarboxylase [Candidatus Aminicenantes bacterium]
ALAGAGTLWVLGAVPLALLFFLLALAFVFFFRDPRRTPPPGEHLLVAPADGRVVRTDRLDHQPELGGAAQRVSIFLSILDVHVTRSPMTADVARVDYRPGTFFRADKEEASLHNESNTLVLAGGPVPLVVKQIVGVAARRIKCFVKAGERVARGQRIGLMYFGSRVEVVLPPQVRLRVAAGQRVKAGESVIGEVPR